MQKLQLELKNTPTSTPQACSSVNLELNRVEKLSALDIKLDCNNPNVDIPQHKEGKTLSYNVYVINVEGLKKVLSIKDVKKYLILEVLYITFKG